ncbi:MAG: glycine/sarcosine/betaine reductase selenoprotein B family protein [Brevefilum sp.]
MPVLDQDFAWRETFRHGWLSHFHQTGKINWDLYVRPQNQTSIAGMGVDLKSSRLMLISSAGGYLPDSQQPFHADDPLGDYSIRVLPHDTALEHISYAHDHFDHTAVKLDPQVLLPLDHLREMVVNGEIGALSDVVSFMGYQPDVSRLIDETIPAIVDMAVSNEVNCALLVPA